MKGAHVGLASDKTIKQLLHDGKLEIVPSPDDDLIQPSSVDIHLHRYFQRFTATHDVIDPASDQPGMTVPEEVPAGGVFVLAPGEFALGSVLQHVKLSAGIAAQVDGRSSVGRLGLLVHATAGWCDAGFAGHITLELKNLHQDKTIWLYPGMRLAQLVISNLTTPAEHPYGDRARSSSYQNQGAWPQPSAMHRNWKLMPTEGEARA